MPNRQSIAERAKRRRACAPLRSTAAAVLALTERLRRVENRLGLPAGPYGALLAEIREYYNELADEFEDIPDCPTPLQSYEAAMRRVQEVHAAHVAYARSLPDGPLACALRQEERVFEDLQPEEG